LCKGDWAKHGACNTFKGETTEHAAQEKLLHYYARFDVHQQSQKFEEPLRLKAFTLSSQINKRGGNAVLDATEILIRCRRVLKHTYAHAYSLAEGPAKHLFEFLQAELEQATETLSGALEAQNPSILNVSKYSQNAERRLNNLLQSDEA